MWDTVKCEYDNNSVSSKEILKCSICGKHICKKHFELHKKENGHNKARGLIDKNIINRDKLKPRNPLG